MYALLRGRFTSLPHRPRPFFLSHMVTNRCNCDCPYCYWKYPKPDELSLEEIEDLYRQAQKSRFAHNSIWGGEPLLRPDIEQIVQASRKNMMLTTVVTNGFNLERNHRFARWADTVVVSIDAPGPLHDELRAFPGLFEKAREGLRRLRKDYPKVQRRICCVVSRANFDRLEAMCAFARKEGAVIYFCPIGKIESISGWKGVERVAAVTRTPEDVSNDFRRISELKRSGFPVANSDHIIDHFILGGPHFSCYLPRTYLYIYSNGDVESCFDGIFANLRERTLSEILSSEDLRNISMKGDQCNLSCSCSEAIESNGLWEWRWAALKTWAFSSTS